uniref:Uncharacterized protein n=1 Tax=Compsopogon caeruleus TaxID=31354 RepID=A0A7S1XEE4_9RHOD
MTVLAGFIVPDSQRSRLRSILREYSANWKVSLEHIRQAVRREFPNFRNGEVVLKRLLTQLLINHRKVESEIDHIDSQLRREMVPSASLVFEIRRSTEEFEFRG